MSEDIKEILEYYKRSNKNKFGYEQDKIITYKEAHLLLDYITNSQEEIERLNNIIEELKEWVISDIKMFEKLKEDNDKEYYLGRITTAKKVLSYFEKVDDE